jgi:UDP-N-acetyl-D-mannosaminuronic acid transferase (WecB/TagA/CpsF family)
MATRSYLPDSAMAAIADNANTALFTGNASKKSLITSVVIALAIADNAVPDVTRVVDVWATDGTVTLALGRFTLTQAAPTKFIGADMLPGIVAKAATDWKIEARADDTGTVGYVAHTLYEETV